MLKQLQISSVEVWGRLKLSCQLAPTVQQTVRQRIIDHAAQAAGITISEEELQQGADNFRAQHNLSDPATTWEWLTQNYLTGDDFEQLIGESMLTAKLVQHLFAPLVEPYFYEHQLDFTQAALYEVIFADFETAIEQFYAIEEKEITFAEVARQYIAEPNLRRQHGYQGLQSRTTLNSAISATVFGANPPQVLKPIIVEQNVHLILVEEIIEPQLDQSLREQILQQLFFAWFEQQLQQYSITVEASSESAQPICSSSI